MKSTRREFLKGIGIITAGTGLGALVASLPKPTYEVPNRSGDDFWIGNPDLTDDMEVEWTHVPATKQNTFIIPPIWWGEDVG